MNRDSVLTAASILPLEKDGTLYCFYLDPQNSAAVARVADAKVTIETHLAGLAEVYVAKSQNLAVKPSAKPKKGEPDIILQTFSYQTLFESDVDVERSVSINGTTKLEFTLPEPGLWFVYLRKKNVCWALELLPPPQDEHAFPSMQ